MGRAAAGAVLALVLLAGCGAKDAARPATAESRATTCRRDQRTPRRSGREVFELVDRAVDYRGSHQGRPAASFRQMGIDSLTPTTVRRLVNLAREPVITVAFRRTDDPRDHLLPRRQPDSRGSHPQRRAFHGHVHHQLRARSGPCASGTGRAAEPLPSMVFASPRSRRPHPRRRRPGLRLGGGADALGRPEPADHAVRRAGRDSCGGPAIPLLLPLERRVIRAGGSPQDAPLWLVGIVIAGGLLLLSLVQWLAGFAATLEVAGAARGRGPGPVSS